MTIRDLLALRQLNENAVAVAVNQKVLPRESWPSIILRDGDQVDIVRAVAGGADADLDPLIIAGRTFRSRLILGTGKYPSPDSMVRALAASGTEMVTVAIRYMDLEGKGDGLDIMPHLDLTRYQLLPNTAGATTVDQAIYMADLGRAATGTNWVKLEVIGDMATLWPDTAATVEATHRLVADGFVVLAYTSPDLVAALRLENAGAAAVMPLASPIGSRQGFQDWTAVRRIAERVSAPVVVDAGLGVPSDAAKAMELGADACLINTAIARAADPVRMALAMKLAVEAGRQGFLAGPRAPQESAEPSSPTRGVVGAAIE
jgi:thiazole synthase